MSDATFKLPESLNIAAAEAPYEQLSDSGYEQRIELDGSEVQLIDTAGIQLLLVLQKRIAHHGGAIVWNGVSDALRKSFDSIGLSGFLGAH